MVDPADVERRVAFGSSLRLAERGSPEPAGDRDRRGGACRHRRAADELDLVLSDLATWVDVDTPGGDHAALDGLARVLALTAERYGLSPS